MQIHLFQDKQALDIAVAQEFVRLLQQHPHCILGLATGGTPVGMYARLSAACGRGDISFAQCQTFNLDEYVGLSRTHPASYYQYMSQNLFSKVDLPLSQCHLPDGQALDSIRECQAYEQSIAHAGGIDLQLLGLGHNGHIGFNEPGTPIDSLTHVVQLSPTTRYANARFFKNAADVPTQAITMGIRSILNAKRIICMVSGADKAEIVRRVLRGTITPDVPATLLRNHPKAALFIDRQAASLL